MSDAGGTSGRERAGSGGEPARRERPAGRPEAPPADGAGGGGAGPDQFPGEVRGPKGPEPTRFGDWEKGGRCFDF
jgi:hypothetical protein